MGRKKINPLDKRRLATQSDLAGSQYSAAKASAARRRASKRFNHPDIKRGSALGKQARPLRSDSSFPRTADEVLQQLAAIREVATELKKKTMNQGRIHEDSINCLGKR